MEFHKSLYKSISNTLSNSPNARKQNIKYGRQSKRIDMFQQNRIFSISPTPSVLEKELPKYGNNNRDKENVGTVQTTKRVTAQQEAYVSKFLAWKKQKELEKQTNINLQKKRPFITACSGNILGVQKSFAPENHKFKAPTNIISTLTENRKYVIRNVPKKSKLIENKETNVKQEKNFIALNKKFVSTPKLKLIPNSKVDSNINSAAKSAKSKDENKTPVSSLAKRARDNLENKITNKPKRLKAMDKNDKNDEIKMNGNLLIDADKQKPGTYVKLLKPITPMTRRVKSSNNAQKQGLESNTKPGIENKLKLPKPNIMKQNIKAKIVKPVIHPVKKVVSIKSPHVDKVQNKKPFQVQKTPYKSDQKLKRVKKRVQSKESNKLNKNKDIKTVTTAQSSKLLFFEKPKIVIYQETPDEHNEPLNTSFVTSTRRKFSTNSGNIVPPELGESILSPIETEIVENETKTHVPLIDLFVHRQSDVKSKENEILAVPLETSKSPELDKTPVNTKLNNENESTIYVSPFVTLSRGKCSIKKEKKLRESIYNLDESSDGIISAEIRRVKETVKYFRKMLNDEIVRLEARCKDWEEYVKNTDSALFEDYGNDMVNVAIGQTRLLINKKFEQFKKLINQCEKFSQEKNKIKKVDDSEKPILPEDLEGFWQMMYIQVDDIDERFRKLERWRSNDWKDPDEIDEIQVKPKNKNKLLSKVVKKKKTGPVSTDIRKKLKEMYMVHMERKKQESEQNDIIIMTPSKKSRKSISCNNDDSATQTPLRRSKRISTALTTPSQMFNKDNTPSRKSLRIETVMNAASKILNENPGTPKHNMSQFRLISLIKTPCIACPGDAACSPRPRKSILKTPGTQKRRQTVIFNEDIQFKSPEKICGSAKSKKQRSSSGRKSISVVSSQKKERKRSLNLRARRLLLDPEAKIEIPTK